LGNDGGCFFINPCNVLEEFMVDWIAYQTDCLSGIKAPYSGLAWGDGNNRWWFGARAAEQNRQSNKI
jgi:hypothetical protein